MLSRRIRIQLVAFTVIAIVITAVTLIVYMRVPTFMLGVGRYTVTVQLPQAGGLYEGGNVTYRGVEVGRVTAVRLAPTGIEADLQLKSDIPIPSDLRVEVHSMTAVGEQYVALLPQSDNAPPLKGGDVIPASAAYVPPDINSLLNATNRGLGAIPKENLKTVVDEGYTAVGGLGPDLSRLVKGSTQLAIDSRKNLDSLTNLIDGSKPLLDSQIETSDSIQAWAAHLATVTSQLKDKDANVRTLLQEGSPALGEARQLFDRLQPTLPIVLANLVSVGEVAVTYRGNLEQVLVLAPQDVGVLQALVVANADTKQDYHGAYLSFNLNLNLPPACTTGFLPPQQMRSPALEDYPPRPPGNLYCRIPQDAPNAVRGARNYPCETRPGKRAATVKLCESDRPYVPLNDGFNWKGDPNATLSGQGVPELDPGEEAPAQQPSPVPGVAPPEAAPPDAPPPLAVAQYDAATGTYIGPDGQIYKQSDLARGAKEGQTWQSMLTPPAGN
ncbi:MCE family protein [Mycobacterium sp. DBP42]|uniref:MCE family protein n=1 Tax=Mycobacterium sp. DBP42 TaxID=2545267 RepID=UPI00110C9658|nr:MlaD family protein [Mycobacterium sp. DBP42]TMS52468.1 MCE family protein [Mycobacterium sp. DBP42]